MSIKGLITTDKGIYFFGNKSIYSNFYIGDNTSFEHKGHKFICGEHAYMWEKAIYFKDEETLDILVNLPEDTAPSYMKHLGYKIKGFDNDEWSKVKYERMVEVLESKFSSRQLSYKLLKTGTKELVESSTDKVWGTGIPLNSPHIGNKEKWKGTNLLGKALMEVRDKLGVKDVL